MQIESDLYIPDSPCIKKNQIQTAYGQSMDCIFYMMGQYFLGDFMYLCICINYICT